MTHTLDQRIAQQAAATITPLPKEQEAFPKVEEPVAAPTTPDISLPLQAPGQEQPVTPAQPLTEKIVGALPTIEPV